MIPTGLSLMAIPLDVALSKSYQSGIKYKWPLIFNWRGSDFIFNVINVVEIVITKF